MIYREITSTFKSLAVVSESSMAANPNGELLLTDGVHATVESALLLIVLSSQLNSVTAATSASDGSRMPTTPP